MSYGLQVLNTTSRIQIDQDFRNARLVASGSRPAGQYYFPMPYLVTLEPPIVLMRPSVANSYVGATNIAESGDFFGYDGANGYVVMGGQHAYDYAIFSAQYGTPVSDGATYGLNVFRSDGSVAYDSRQQHPNIKSLHLKAANSTSGGGYPNVFTISGFSSMPWILANPLVQTWAGVGEFSESVGCVMAAVNSGFTTLTVDFRDAAASGYPVFPALSDRANYNPYFGTTGWFGVAYYA
jgi:hypothetical protein